MKDKINFDLQLFSDKGGEAQEPPVEPIEPTDPPIESQEPKTFTQEELENILEKRLAREKAKQEETLRAAIQKEQEEAKRLAELSAEERAKEEAEKTAKRLKELEEQIRIRDLELDTTERLKEEGLDISFKNFLMGSDADSTNENIKTFKGVFDAKVQEEVEKRLKGDTPTRGGKIKKEVNPFKRETFNLTEQGRLFRENPELAVRLKKEANN